VATSPIAEANRNQDLAELVWRHFREEIGQTLAEVQEDLAHRQSSSDYKVDQEKR
jgi:predicted nuclease of restriction endonuclease-like RecB superfamily